MSKPKNSFVLYKDWMQLVYDAVQDEDITLEDAGTLFCIISELQNYGEIKSKIPVSLKLLVKELVNTFRRDAEKWEETREKRVSAGRDGGLANASKSKQMVANGSKCYDGEANSSKPEQTLANQAVTVTVSGSVTGSGNVNASVSDKLPPDGVEDAVWKEWVAYRKKIKAPVSETVLKGLRREGDKAGIGLQQVLETCLTNGWRGFQAEWYLKNKPKEPLGSNGLPLSHASNINEKHREEKTGDFTQDDWDRLMKTGKYKQ